MTREEAIKRLEDTFEAWEGWIPHNDSPASKLSEALGMAIAALRERDALLAEIKDMCHLCRHYNNGFGDAACYNCCEEDAFVWRGAKEEV